MRAAIYLSEVKQENLLATVDVEVCPRGIYQIDHVEYELLGQPKFIIGDQDRAGDHHLQYVELVVEKYDPNRPKVFRSPA